jgi:hypothetical protein
MFAGGTVWGTKIALLISILKVKRFTLIEMRKKGPEGAF